MVVGISSVAGKHPAHSSVALTGLSGDRLVGTVSWSILHSGLHGVASWHASFSDAALTHETGMAAVFSFEHLAGSVAGGVGQSPGQVSK